MALFRRIRVRLADALQTAAGPDGAYAGGRRLQRLQRYSEAADAFAQAERAYVKRLGSTHSRVVDAMSQRAWCEVMLGQLSDGVATYRQALDAKLANGDASPPTAADIRRLLTDAELSVHGRGV